jgi:hypothetical protein
VQGNFPRRVIRDFVLLGGDGAGNFEPILEVTDLFGDILVAPPAHNNIATLLNNRNIITAPQQYDFSPVVYRIYRLEFRRISLSPIFPNQGVGIAFVAPTMRQMQLFA